MEALRHNEMNQGCSTGDFFYTVSPTCLLRFDDPKYTDPTPTDVRAALQMVNMSEGDAARLIGVNPQIFKLWMEGAVRMRYSTWRTLLTALRKLDS